MLTTTDIHHTFAVTAILKRLSLPHSQQPGQWRLADYAHYYQYAGKSLAAAYTSTSRRLCLSHEIYLLRKHGSTAEEYQEELPT